MLPTLKVPNKVMMLAHNFISEEDAPASEGWDPANPNGFGAGPPDENNTNGVPGYTYTTNGEDVGVEDKGPGYYQVSRFLAFSLSRSGFLALALALSLAFSLTLAHLTW